MASVLRHRRFDVHVVEIRSGTEAETWNPAPSHALVLVHATDPTRRAITESMLQSVLHRVSGADAKVVPVLPKGVPIPPCARTIKCVHVEDFVTGMRSLIHALGGVSVIELLRNDWVVCSTARRRVHGRLDSPHLTVQELDPRFDGFSHLGAHAVASREVSVSVVVGASGHPVQALLPNGIAHEVLVRRANEGALGSSAAAFEAFMEEMNQRMFELNHKQGKRDRDRLSCRVGMLFTGKDTCFYGAVGYTSLAIRRQMDDEATQIIRQEAQGMASAKLDKHAHLPHATLSPLGYLEEGSIRMQPVAFPLSRPGDCAIMTSYWLEDPDSGPGGAAPWVHALASSRPGTGRARSMAEVLRPPTEPVVVVSVERLCAGSPDPPSAR